MLCHYRHHHPNHHHHHFHHFHNCNHHHIQNGTMIINPYHHQSSGNEADNSTSDLQNFIFFNQQCVPFNLIAHLICKILYFSAYTWEKHLMTPVFGWQHLNCWISSAKQLMQRGLQANQQCVPFSQIAHRHMQYANWRNWNITQDPIAFHVEDRSSQQRAWGPIRARESLV